MTLGDQEETPELKSAKFNQVEEKTILRLRKLSRLLDSRFKIPVLNIPIGLDAIIGLIPGIGDTATAALSVYIIYEAHKVGARKSTIIRMIVNTGLDYLIGLLPVLGDFFDVLNKSNVKNIELLLDDLENRQH